MNKARETPQEKKIRTYVNQRQNAYGENDKSSRSALQKRKRWVNRSFRRKLNNISHNTNFDWDEIDVEIKSSKRKNWKKCPDMLFIELAEIKWSGSSRSKVKPIRSKLRTEAIKRIRKSGKKIDI